MKIFLLLIIISAIITALTLERLTPRDVQAFNRISNPAVSARTKDFVVYENRKWDPEAGKSTTWLECVEIATKQVYKLTSPEPGKRDYNPVFSSQFANHMAFLSNRSGSPQIWLLGFDPKEIISRKLPVPTQLTNYEVPISNLKWHSKYFAFTAEVYTKCNDDFSCTSNRDKLIEKRGPNTWQTYDSLMMRHWDHWVSEKVSHIFLQEINQNMGLEGGVKDQLPKMETNTPVPPFGGAEQFDIRENSVVFTGQDRTRRESWSTDWKIYHVDKGAAPYHLTSKIYARTQQPKFSPNGERIAYLAMKRENSESDGLHLEIYSNGVTIDVTGDFDRTITDYTWVDNNLIIFIATDQGVDEIYAVETATKTRVIKLTGSLTSSSLPIHIGNNLFIVQRTAIDTVSDLYLYSYDPKQRIFSELSRLTDSNSQGREKLYFAPFERFFYSGSFNDTIQGFLVKPYNFDPNKKYPLAFLIHGGPESAWKSTFGYGWNSQLWSARGYVVVMINPHGSVGNGQKFTDAVLNDWGGAPYNDLMMGLDYVLKSFTFIDGNRACAAGASYGGYMVNWIQGNTDRFKCLITHDGVFSTLASFYSTDELWFPFNENCPTGKYGCTPWDPNYRDGYLKFNPESLVNNWKTPHLIIHGSNDFRLSITEGLSAFTALQLKGVESRLLHFSEENHWTLREENVLKWYEEILNWMDKFTQTK